MSGFLRRLAKLLRWMSEVTERVEICWHLRRPCYGLGWKDCLRKNLGRKWFAVNLGDHMLVIEQVDSLDELRSGRRP